MKTELLCLTLIISLLTCRGQTEPQQQFSNDTLRITLPEVWQKAEQFNREIEMTRKEVAIRNEEVMDTRAQRLPEINVDGFFEKATNMPIYQNGLFSAPTQHDIIHTLGQLGTEFYLNLYNGNKLNLRIEESKILYKIASIQKDRSISDIRYNAAAAYLELQKSVIFRNLVLNDIADREKQLHQIKVNYQNGLTLKSDLLRAEVDLSRKKVALLQIDNDITIANQKLNILIGENDDRVVQPIDIQYPQGEIIVSYEEYLTKALEHSFAYQASEQQTILSKNKLQQVKGNVQPQIGLFGQFYYANPQIFLYPYNPNLYSLGLGGIKVSFPLSSFYHNKHKTEAARLELEKEEINHKNTADQVRQQVKEAYLRYKETLAQINVAKENVEKAIESERIIKNAYFNQTALITDLLDANVQALQAKFELASAQIMAQNKYYLLQNVIGSL